MTNLKKAYIVPLLLIIAVLVLGGIYFYSKNQNSVVTQNSQNPQPAGPSNGSSDVNNNPTPAPSGNHTLPANWVTGSFMDYPNDVTVTAAVEGSRKGPTFTFPKTYFVGSKITSAVITTPSSCGGEVPASNTTIEGQNFYRSADGLTYYLKGACNQEFLLTITPSTAVKTNSSALQNIRTIFDKMVASYAKKNTSAVTSQDWKTYTNAQAHLTMQYPSELVVDEHQPVVIFHTKTTSPGFSIHVSKITSSYSSVQDIVTNAYTNADTGQHAPFSSFKKVVLGTNTFYSIRTELFEGVLGVNYYLIDPKGIYLFNLNSQGVDWTNPNFDQEKDLGNVTLKAMLATFKTI